MQKVHFLSFFLAFVWQDLGFDTREKFGIDLAVAQFPLCPQCVKPQRAAIFYRKSSSSQFWILFIG